jgi:ribosomal protein S18 acetylase RimI-like enzyme
LIQWLRPNAPPWATNQPSTTKWQCRRIQRAIYEGTVFRSAPVSHILPQHHKSSSEEDEAKDGEESGSCVDAGAAVMLFPPRKSWTLPRLLLGAKLWLLNWCFPVVDNDANEKVGANSFLECILALESNVCCPQRIEQLIQVHGTALDRIKSKYKVDHLWYLEVIALHPSLQNRGLGRKTMEWVLNHIGQQPVALECTAEQNVKFYEKLGFVTSEVAHLSDAEGSVTLWFMVRLPTCIS